MSTAIVVFIVVIVASAARLQIGSSDVSDEVSTLFVSLVAAMSLFGISILVHVRGPVGIIKNIDWNRVSDMQGLGHYVGLIMSIMGALVAAHGVWLYTFQGDARVVGTTVFTVLMVLLALALIVGALRYQDQPRRDGSR